ncbi:hypothetical protein [Bacteriophage Titan-X]|uniref:Uncharacterized protein n=1 Tax=Bacteriophage Titan-X TaxID=2662140 RepID=A0A5Q2UAI8_9CAUD|nr:hypothetical protein [Bacteriophage Titan-X]
MIRNAQVRGQFQLFAARVDEEGVRHVRKLTEKFDNLITNSGMDQLGTTSGYLAYCHVGVGTTTPAFTDTQLASWLAYTNSTYQSDGVDGSTEEQMRTAATVWGSRTRYFQFAQGAVVGNVTEIGVSTSSGTGSSYPLFSRTLIKDAEGNPTSVTVLASEYLCVAYTLTVYLDGNDVSGTFVFDGNTYNYTSGFYNTSGQVGASIIANFIGSAMALSNGAAQRNNVRLAASAWSGGRTANAPSTYGSTSVSGTTYVPGSFVWEYTISAPPSAANGRWYGVVYDVGWMNYRVEFPDNLTKTSDYTWTLVVRQSWSRYTP